MRVLQFFIWRSARRRRLVYARALEADRVRTAPATTRCGFCADHHVQQLIVCPWCHEGHARRRPPPAVCASARRVRDAVHHPLRLAEKWQLLYHFRAGRVPLGRWARSSRSVREFRVAAEKAPRDSARPVESCLRRLDRGAAQLPGTHFHIDGVEYLPKPLQQPHPPVWMAATLIGIVGLPGAASDPE